MNYTKMKNGNYETNIKLNAVKNSDAKVNFDFLKNWIQRLSFPLGIKLMMMRHKLESERGEFGISSVIGIAIGLIVAAFILIPGIQTFASKIISDMQLWWTNSISTQIFPN